MRPSMEAKLSIRPYRREDESGVLDLLRISLGRGPAGDRLPELFRWKHMDNPFGRSFLLVGEAEGRVAGLRAFMRWRFLSGEQTVEAVRAVDTATHPDFHGRGVFSALTLQGLEDLRGETDLVFNTPNEKSLPGYLKMGWRRVGRIPVAVRIRRLGRVAAGFRTRSSARTTRPAPAVGGDPVRPFLEYGEEMGDLLLAPQRGHRFVTPRSPEYLRWRYASAPALDYRAVSEERGGRLAGLAIYRVRPRGQLWELTVCELLVRPGDGVTARRLLRDVVRAARVDHVTCSFPAGSLERRASRWSVFLPVPGGITFVVNHLARDVWPDPFVLRNWALSLGDLEVF
jgi:hypothetical protein